MTLLILIAVLVALAGAFALIYNRLVRLRNRTDNAWSQVDVQLKRRYDLIPNLVESVKAFASHEKETFEEVTKARQRARAATTVEEQGRAETLLSGAIGNLIAVAEAYPELKSARQFLELQESLTQTEDKISVARHIYNDTILTYNNAVQTFPSNLVARPMGFSTRPYFEAEERSREAPEVAL